MKRRVWSRRVAAGHRVSAERHQRSAHSGRWQQLMRPKGERRLLPKVAIIPELEMAVRVMIR